MMQNHNQQKKIALINDFTGFGRCSIAVQMPIISMLKVQCCAVPTSIFSNHTAYEDYYFTDYTSNMEAYIEQWKKLDLKFEGICTGFLGSAEQIRIVSEFIQYFRDENTVAVIDPVMGDNGRNVQRDDSSGSLCRCSCSKCDRSMYPDRNAIQRTLDNERAGKDGGADCADRT